MLKQSNSVRSWLGLLCCAGGLLGCSSSPLSGRRIVEDLERDRIPVPDNSGRMAPSAHAAALPAQGPIYLGDLLSVAEAQHPSLATARSAVGIAAGERWQASLYPNPYADILSEDISFNDGVDDAKTTVGITQPIIIGGRRQAAMDAADAAKDARLAEVEAQRRTIFGEVATEYARLIASREQSSLYRELKEVAGRTLAAAEARFAARAVPETDVIRPRVEVHRIDAALARLAQEQAAIVRRLGLLLGGVEFDAARIEGNLVTDPPPLNIEALQASVRTSHPALTAADRDTDAAAARLSLVQAQRTPDLDVRVGVGYRAENDDGVVEVGAGMTLPLWDAHEGDMLAARFRLMQARQQREVIENDLLACLATAAGDYESARAQLVTFREQIVPDAQRAFDQTGEGYRGGRASFLDLLDAQRTLTEARATQAELAGNAAVARAALIQIVGPNGFGGADSVTVTNVSTTTNQPHNGAEAMP